MKFIILGIFALMLCIGCEAQSRVAFVSFAVQYNFQNQVDGTTDMTINAALLPHDISDTIQGSQLWRLGFFRAQNAQGTGPRASYIYQLLTPVQASRTATPGQSLTFVVNERLNLNVIGPEQDFPYYCVEFGKNEVPNPDFIFQVGNDVTTAVLCQSSENLPSEIRACPGGYIGAETTGMCYKILEDPLAFDDARAACQADGADLASASTPAKNMIVSGLASGQRCWVGAIIEAGNYEWLNGDQWQYTNWHKREPNYHLTGRACIETNFMQPYLWNDHYCTSKRIAVCEKAMTTA